MDSVVKLSEKLLSYLEIVPLSLIAFGFIFKGTFPLFNLNKDLSYWFFAFAFIAWLWPYTRKLWYQSKYPINKVGIDFLLVWVDGVGYLVEKFGKNGRRGKVRWIESWHTASDLEFFGYRSVFNKENTPKLKEIVEVDKRLDYVLIDMLGFKDWEFGKGIRTRSMPGS